MIYHEVVDVAKWQIIYLQRLHYSYLKVYTRNLYFLLNSSAIIIVYYINISKFSIIYTYA